MAPFVKTGGLGDVVGALPKAMASQGHEVRVFIPHYDDLDLGTLRAKSVQCQVQVSIGGKNYPVSLRVINFARKGVSIYLIGNRHFFSRDGIYTDSDTGKDFTDNDERFIFFSRAVLAVLQDLDFRPDIVHAHDWQTALLPVFLKTSYADDPFFGGIHTVLTVHNLAYQGKFDAVRFSLLDLNDELLLPATGALEFYGDVNFLKAGLIYADHITTVSRQYAEEIQTPEFGCGLDGVLTERRKNLTGILNGVDYSIWSPSIDSKTYARYHINNLSGKRTNKVEFLGDAGLPIRDKVPLIGIISRLEDQKGWDLIAAAADHLMEMNVQMAVVGTGQPEYHELLNQLQMEHPDKFRCWLKFDDILAHRIEAASDIFLMPSRFEPCGLNQLYSLKYGTVPIVRKVGGLADTIVDYDPATAKGNGFVFEEATSESMLEAVERAVNLFGRKRAWTKVMKAGMRQDFSWNRSAKTYLGIFQQLIKT